MERKKLLVLIYAVTICILSTTSYAQVDTAWVRIYNGPASDADEARAIAVDRQGNVYVTGYSRNSAPDNDYLTIKYNANGQEQWVNRYDGPGHNNDEANALAIDGQGNVYVTGFSYDSITSLDIATIKYNSAGETVWVRRYSPPISNSDNAHAIAVDGQGNVYVTGTSYSTNTYYDYLTIKYYANGDTAWIKKYNGPGNWYDYAYAIAVDTLGNVYVTGLSSGTNGSSFNYTTIKYNPNGDTAWLRIYNGPGDDDDWAHAITVDNDGNVYITGESYGSGTNDDYATIKYNADGDTMWVRRYNGPGNNSDQAYAIAVDTLGNVYITGESPVSGTSDDYATIKYNSAGDTVWVRRYNGLGSSLDKAYDLALDDYGNVYVTGSSRGSTYVEDYATIKYSSTGDILWIHRYNGPSNGYDYPSAIAVDSAGFVYVTGMGYGSGIPENYMTIKYVQTGAVEEIENCQLKNEKLSIFPNPAKSHLTIHLAQFVDRIEIFDVTGKTVQRISELGVGDLRISLAGIKNGIYFVKVNDQMIKEKLVVTK
jgi:uncharacterized delta-60 repeat protein